ncbi:MAG: hypothetical protein WD069_05785 [Planctomycetales bacterium]
MEVRHTVEIAALVAAHNGRLIESRAPLPTFPLELVSKTAADRARMWEREFDASDGIAPSSRRGRFGRSLREAAEEVLAAEVLTRVWAATLIACDLRRGRVHAEPVARGILLAQLRARRRVLELLVAATDARLAEWAPVDDLRRRAERWTDLLLGRLVVEHDVCDLAFDAERAREFGAEQLDGGPAAGSRQVWEFVLAGIQLAFAGAARCPSPLAAHHRAIAGAVLATFPPQSFAGDGPFRPVWQGWLRRSATSKSPPEARGRIAGPHSPGGGPAAPR